MPQRFEYVQFTGKEFREALQETGIRKETFARITGTKLSRVEEWLHDRQIHGIPPWVRIVLALLRMPGAIVIAKDEAAEMISRDNLWPDRGEFPYLGGDDNED